MAFPDLTSRLAVRFALITLGALLALLILVRFATITLGEEDPANGRGAMMSDSVPVIVTPVTMRTEEVRIEAVGTARAMKSVTLFPEVGGEVTAVNFNAGDRVEKGDILIELDARQERLDVEAARNQLANAQQILTRYDEAGEGAVSALVMDESRTAVQAARIAVNQAEERLYDQSVRAPFDGIIGLTEIDAGDRIGPDTEIASLDARETLLVDFPVPEAYLTRIDIGDPVEAATWTASTPEAAGEIVYLDSRVDPVSRTVTVRAALENVEDRLRPGMSFRMTLDLQGREYPVVPEVSILWGGEGSYLWAIKDGGAQRVSATIVQRLEGRVLVDAALQEGDLVVEEGVQRMREGVQVDYERDPTASGPAEPVAAP